MVRVGQASGVAAGAGRRRSPIEHPRVRYGAETAALREVALGCGLVESLKWGKPCFGLAGETGAGNVVLIQGFKEYVALLFFKGALLEDAAGLLHAVGKMGAPRQLRFRSVEEIEAQREAIRGLILQAVEVERRGEKVPVRAVEEVAVPEELQRRLDGDAALRVAFAGLTPGRRKAYLYQIAAAKQAATRAGRVEKFVPRILAGKGWNE